MNNDYLSLEVLKTATFDSSFQHLSFNEKLDQLIKAYEKIYQNISINNMDENNMDDSDDKGEDGGPRGKNFDLALEILRIAVSDSDFQKLSLDEKLNQILQAYERIRRSLSGNNNTEINLYDGGPRGGQAIAVSILQIVYTADTKVNDLDFSERVEELLKRLNQISTQLAEMVI